MKLFMLVCLAALAALPNGSTPALTGKDIALSLELANQDKDGFPHAFSVTFQNKTDHKGVLGLPRPIAAQHRGETYFVAPFLGVGVTASEGREGGLLYADMKGTRPATLEQVVLGPGERTTRLYSTSDLYAYVPDGFPPRGRFTDCVKAGTDEAQVSVYMVVSIGVEETDEGQQATASAASSEPVTMHCSLDPGLFEKTAPKPTPLSAAVAKGDVQAVQRLIAQGADVNQTGHFPDTTEQAPPLQVAATFGQTKVAEVLLANGANVNSLGEFERTPLHVAANGDVARLLVSKGADIEARDGLYGRTPLHYAAENGHSDVAELLISKGADVNAKDPNGQTPLHEAAIGRHKDMIELLISKGADVNAKDVRSFTPLQWAVQERDKESVELLVAKGADVKAKNDDGYDALGWAAQGGDKEIVEFLIAKGADVDARSRKGDTPLYCASTKDVAELLVSKGANVKDRDNAGQTPMHVAAFLGYRDVVEFLISEGADVNAKDREGQTPLHKALGNNHKEVANFLISEGADVNVKDKDGRTPQNLTRRQHHGLGTFLQRLEGHE